MPSPIDRLFEQLFGYFPTKEGEAYERLAAAVCKLLSDTDAIFHDKRLRGSLSKTLYQIDVLKQSQHERQFGEAKDYTEAKRKVGRPDLQKLGGAIPELDVDGGIFFSATDFTKPARKYANASDAIVGKPIQLVHLRPSTHEDEKGRITEIVVEIVFREPDYANARFEAIFTEEGRRKAERLVEQGLLNDGDNRIRIDKIYKSDGDEFCTIQELTSQGFPGQQEELTEGTFSLSDCAVLCGEELLPINGIRYRVPFVKTTREIQIQANGRAVLVFKDVKGTIDKLITDTDIRKISFSDEGEAVMND